MLDQTNLSVMLKNKNLLKNKAYINGAWVDAKSGKTFEVVNPSNGNSIVTVPEPPLKPAAGPAGKLSLTKGSKYVNVLSPVTPCTFPEIL